MKAAIIGASAEALHTIEKAKQHGITVVALDGNPEAEGLAAADKALVVDISEEAETIEAVKAENIDFLLTVPIGRFLTTVGAVNDALHLPGVGKQAAENCTDKYRFHQVLSSKHLRSCRCFSLDGSADSAQAVRLKAEAEGIEFPAILKPRFGSGSRGIYFLEHLEELSGALEQTLGEAYILEECVEGEEYGVDGAVINGEFYFVLLRKKENTPPPARQAVAYFSVLPEEEFYHQVKSYMKEVTLGLDLQECLFHADIIRSKQGPFAIEVSARPSGHNLHNLFTPLCTGVDMAEEYAKCRIGEAYSFVPDTTKRMMIHYFDMEGLVEKVPTQGEVEELCKSTLKEWQCNIRKGDLLPKVSDGHSLMGRGYFIAEGECETELKETAEKIKNLFHCSEPCMSKRKV